MNGSKCLDFIIKLFEEEDTIRYFQIPNTIFIVVHAVLILTAIFGNIVLLTAIWKTESLQTPSYLLITSLAIADLLVGMVFHPMQIAMNVYFLQSDPQCMCDMVLAYVFVTTLLSGVSFSMSTCISIDRYLAISLKQRYRTTVTKKRVWLIVVSVWTVGIAEGIFSVMPEYLIYFIYFSFCFLSLHALATAAFYIKAFKLLHNHSVQVQDQRQNQVVSRTVVFDPFSHKRTLRTMLVVLVILVLCYMPLLAAIAAIIRSGFNKITVLNFMISITMWATYSSLNLPIYLIRTRDVRQACINTLKGVLPDENTENMENSSEPKV